MQLNAESGRPTIPEVVADFARYYADNPTWGSLHIVLDDYNVEDSHVDFCISFAEQKGDTEGLRLAKILRSMSKTQRKKLGHAAEHNDGEVPGT